MVPALCVGGGGGVFAGDSKMLSLRSCFPLLHEVEQKHGSIVWGMMRRKAGECLEIKLSSSCFYELQMKLASADFQKAVS